MAEGFTCEVEEPFEGKYRSACEGLDFYGELEGKRFCVLHFPGDEKKGEFKKTLENKLAHKDYDFSGTVFPEGTANFDWVEFDANTIFAGAAFFGMVFFEGAEFSGDTSFSDARFSGEGVDFSGAQFSGDSTDFLRAQFRGETTYFSDAEFSGETTYFKMAEFSSGAGTIFHEARFAQEVDFREATFRERVEFWGSEKNRVFEPQAWARFHGSRIEKPESFIFNTVRLHPGWFVNADVRKVEFTDVKWYGMPGWPEGTLDEAIAALQERNVESPHTLLSQACRRLSANAEENRDYPLANEFYYWSMEALRKEGWRSFGLIRTLYWVLSGYGVRAAQAFWVLVVIWAAFTIPYILVPSSPFSGSSLCDFGESIVYSLSALARLNPEPKPEPGLFQLLVTLEGLIGPLQIGLLLLAIRRKVMR